jgi:hypothetical protein
VLVRGWPDLEGGRARALEQDLCGHKKAREEEATAVKAKGCEEEERGMGSTPPRAALFIGGSTESARCGSFSRTIRYNRSILGSSRENFVGIVAD